MKIKNNSSFPCISQIKCLTLQHKNKIIRFIHLNTITDMKKFQVTNIDWCIEAEDCDNNAQVANEILESLPTECEVECEDEDMIADALSDTYGYLVNSYNIA